MKIKIKSRWNGNVIFECEAESIREACEEATVARTSLRGADLRGADLRGADLSGAVLSGAVLSGADLRDAVLSDGLSGIPKIENIHKAVYDAAAAPQALDMGSWHVCETTHCRAGWVIALAGDAGRALEYCLGTPAAAALIYMASDPMLEKIPNFYSTNEEALDDMERLAYSPVQQDAETFEDDGAGGPNPNRG